MPRKKVVQVTLEPKPYYEYVYFIHREDYHKCQKVYNDIYKLVQKSKSVPAELIKEFTSYFYNREEAIKQQYSKELTKILEKVTVFFSLHKEYQFESTGNNESKKKNRPFNFSDCIEHSLIQYWATIWFRQQTGQDKDLLVLIRFFYEVIENYTNPFDTPEELLISDYKKVVIAAYLCEQLDYYIPHEDPDKPLIPEYYKAGRNVIRKKNESQTPPKKRLPKKPR